MPARLCARLLSLTCRPPSRPWRSDEVAGGNVTMSVAEPGFFVYAESADYVWPQGESDVWIDLESGESCSALGAAATPSCKRLVEVRCGCGWPAKLSRRGRLRSAPNASS